MEHDSHQPPTQNLLSSSVSIFLFVTLLYVLHKTRKDPVIEKKLKKFHGPMLLPIIGNAWMAPFMGGLVGKTRYNFLICCFNTVKKINFQVPLTKCVTNL
jgi:hypothetical protein